MKRVIIRCEDVARSDSPGPSLLEGAKTAHLQHLAQAGAAGLIRPKSGARIDRFELHRGLFGLGLQDPEARAAWCYTLSCQLDLGEDDTAWCCDFVTQRDGRIIDLTAGDIPTKESEVLIHALNERLGSEARMWRVGRGARHILVLRDPALGAEGQGAVRSSEALLGEEWKRQLPKGPLGVALRQLIEQALDVLDEHPVNHVRVDLEENPANMFWLWGAAQGAPQKPLAQRAGRSGAVVSATFPMEGFAKSLGLDWKGIPPSLDDGPLQRLSKTLPALIARHDVVYVHLQVASGDPVERLCAMERIDQLVLKPLSETLSGSGSWRLLVAVDDRTNGSVPFVALGSGLPAQPIAQLDAARFAASPLTFHDGLGLSAWLAGTPASAGADA